MKYEKSEYIEENNKKIKKNTKALNENTKEKETNNKTKTSSDKGGNGNNGNNGGNGGNIPPSKDDNFDLDRITQRKDSIGNEFSRTVSSSHKGVKSYKIHKENYVYDEDKGKLVLKTLEVVNDFKKLRDEEAKTEKHAVSKVASLKTKLAAFNSKTGNKFKTTYAYTNFTKAVGEIETSNDKEQAIAVAETLYSALDKAYNDVVADIRLGKDSMNPLNSAIAKAPNISQEIDVYKNRFKALGETEVQVADMFKSIDSIAEEVTTLLKADSLDIVTFGKKYGEYTVQMNKVKADYNVAKSNKALESSTTKAKISSDILGINVSNKTKEFNEFNTVLQESA